jgi:hypothetical protein
LDTLAAAYAESNEFGKATKTVEKAITLAQSNDDKTLVMDLEKRLQLYRAGRAFRE